MVPSRPRLCLRWPRPCHPAPRRFPSAPAGRSCRRSSAILFEKKDILRHYGTSYTFEPICIRGNGSQITALAAGDGTK
jgi:hypothetical protein